MVSEKELFEQVLNVVAAHHNLTVERPYKDCPGYIKVYHEGELLGEMNYDGYLLIYNCGRLYKMCEKLI